MHQPVARKVLSLGGRVVLMTAAAALAAGADYYKLPNIERIDRDLYRSAEVVIETRSCMHRPASEEALLKYEGPGQYKIIWQDHSTCDVERVAAAESRFHLLASHRRATCRLAFRAVGPVTTTLQ